MNLFKIIKPALIGTVIALSIIVIFQGCSKPFYGVPQSNWKTMTQAEKRIAIQNYFSDKAVVVYYLTAKPGVIGVFWDVVIARENTEGKFKKDLREVSRNLSKDGNLVAADKKQMELEKQGIYFRKILPGNHRLSVTPYRDVKYTKEDSCFIYFTAEPGQVVNLGTIRMDGVTERGITQMPVLGVTGVDAIKHVGAWSCDNFSSVMAADSLKIVYPEIYDALQDNMVNR